ncbi:MAG: serine/threonine protein kinase [Candidatus Binatia bacterium]
MATVIGRKYEVLGELGHGGMGVVYKVRHVTLDTTFALKVLPAHLLESEDLTARFSREARVIARLKHPNIVRVIDFDREENLHYLVMEYIEGKTLRQHLQEHGPLPFARLVEIASQVANALVLRFRNDCRVTQPGVHADWSLRAVGLEQMDSSWSPGRGDDRETPLT